jgi:hypothetical protein
MAPRKHREKSNQREKGLIIQPPTNVTILKGF